MSIWRSDITTWRFDFLVFGCRIWQEGAPSSSVSRWGKYPPAKPGALRGEPLKAA